MAETMDVGVKTGDHKTVVKDADGVKVTRETKSNGVEDLPFGVALDAIRNGQQIFRKGWNCEKAGNHCVVYLVEFAADNILGKLQIIIMQTPEGHMSQWHPSVPDMMTDDWCWEPIPGRAE